MSHTVWLAIAFGKGRQMVVTDTEGPCSGPALQRAIALAGMSISEVSRLSGIHRTRLSEALHMRRGVPARWLPMLPPAVLGHVVAGLAEVCGLGLCDLPTAETVTSDVGALSDVVSESADVARVYSEALRDGYLCAAEAEAMERECDEAIAALLSVRMRARAAKRERVIGVAV